MSEPRTQPESEPAVPYRGFLTALTALSTAMVAIDSSIANVALPHMQASLNATPDTIAWVLTSYLIATAVATPITGWLNDLIGRRALMIWSVAGFTVASVLCGMGTSLSQLVVFRLIQGAFGAIIVPLTQAVLLEIYPRSKHGQAMAIYAMAVQIGPILGPILGGFLTDTLSWRWAFYINLPLGAVAVVGFWAFLPDLRRMPRRFDLFGFAFLSIGMASLQLILDRGSRLDWFDSTEIIIESIFVVIGFAVFLVHIFSAQVSILDRRLMRNSTFMLGFLLMAMYGGTSSALNALPPQMLQYVFDYTAMTAGIAMAPRCVGTLIGSWLGGRMCETMDPRIVLGLGCIGSGWAFYAMTGFSPDMTIAPVVITSLCQGTAGGLMFVPLSALAYGTLDRAVMTDASSLCSLNRNLGGAVLISALTAILVHSVQVNHAEMADQVVAGIGSAHSALSIRLLDAEVTRQATLIGYLNGYLVLALVCFGAIPFIFFMKWKKPVIAREEPSGLAPESAAAS